QWKGFNSLLDLKTASLVVDFGTATQFEVAARYPDERKAGDARKVADGLKALIELAMPTLEDALKQAMPAQAKDVIDGIKGALESYRVEQKGPNVSLKFKIENKTFEGLLAGAGVK